MKTTESKEKSEAAKIPLPMPGKNSAQEIVELFKNIGMSAKLKAIFGVGIIAATIAGISMFMKVRAKNEIKKYNRTPRKARRQLRRNMQRYKKRQINL